MVDGQDNLSQAKSQRLLIELVSVLEHLKHACRIYTHITQVLQTN